MNRYCLAIGLVALLGAPALVPAIPDTEFTPLIEKIHAAQDGRDLDAAVLLVERAIQTQQAALTPYQLDQLEHEQERLSRIRRDYSVSRARLEEMCAEAIADFRPEEIDEWEARGWVDWKIVDGEKRYVGPSRSNLFFRYPELRARRTSERGTRWEQFIAAHVEEALREVTIPGEFLGRPRRTILTMTITARDGAATPGEIIRCWMPFPQVTQSQYGVELLDSTPSPLYMNTPQYPTRSLYFEQPANEDGGAVFKAQWTLTTHPRIARIDPNIVQQLDPVRHASVLAWTQEQPPHVAFTPEIRQLAAELTDGIDNPAIRARRIYDWMSENINYSYSREYCTLRNISMYTLTNRYGDCGQISLLYIALCRAAGVPARWQSGWTTVPGGMQNLHDWSEIYLEPYGWVPVDANFAIEARQLTDSLTDEQREMMHDFYFGGMDAYRMIVNTDHGYPHNPPKADWRSDDVDFQRGELETEGRNIYFNQFRYSLEVEHLSDDQQGPTTREGLMEPGMAR